MANDGQRFTERVSAASPRAAANVSMPAGPMLTASLRTSKIPMTVELSRGLAEVKSPQAELFMQVRDAQVRLDRGLGASVLAQRALNAIEAESWQGTLQAHAIDREKGIIRLQGDPIALTAAARKHAEVVGASAEDLMQHAKQALESAPAKSAARE